LYNIDVDVAKQIFGKVFHVSKIHFSKAACVAKIRLKNILREFMRVQLNTTQEFT